MSEAAGRDVAGAMKYCMGKYSFINKRPMTEDDEYYKQIRPIKSAGWQDRKPKWRLGIP